MKKRYLNWANKEWTWFNSSGLINNQFLINDGLSNCKNNGGIQIFQSFISLSLITFLIIR